MWLLQLEELAEYIDLVDFCNADPAVAHLDTPKIPAPPTRQHDAAARLGITYRIADQIHQNPLQQLRIAGDVSAARANDQANIPDAGKHLIIRYNPCKYGIHVTGSQLRDNSTRIQLGNIQQCIQ